MSCYCGKDNCPKCSGSQWRGQTYSEPDPKEDAFIEKLKEIRQKQAELEKELTKARKEWRGF